jgi:hypothetical protein
MFTQLNGRMLAQDYASGQRIVSADNDSQSSDEQVEQVSSTNRQSQDVPASVSNVAQNAPANQAPAQQTTPTDINKKQGKSVKKWILIGVGAAAAFTVVFFMTKSQPEPQVSIGMPSVGMPQ